MNIKTLIVAIASAIIPFTAFPSENPLDNMPINITIDGNTKTANLVDNSSTRALIDRLLQGDVI